MSLTVSGPQMPAWPVRAEPLADQLLLFRRRWRMIFLVTLLLPAVAYVALAVMPPRFTATGILLYDPAGAAPPGDSASLIGTRDEDAVVASQSAIITSLPAARELARRLNLGNDKDFDGNPPVWARLWAGWLKRAPAPDPDRVPLAVRQALEVSVTPNSRVLTVSFTAGDPAVAAAAANLAMALYLSHQRDQAFDDLTDAQSWIETHAAVLQTQLDADETQLAQARAAAGVVAGTQGSLTSETASRLAASLVDGCAGGPGDGAGADGERERRGFGGGECRDCAELAAPAQGAGGFDGAGAISGGGIRRGLPGPGFGARPAGRDHRGD
jgi:uncharacterized protein involved in exopolysaccharide biosynthesis